LLEDLAHTEVDFFKQQKGNMLLKHSRQSFIILMEVPTHKGFTEYNFYDVLLSLTRNAFQQAFFMKKIEKIKRKIKVVSKMRGHDLSEAQIRASAQGVVVAHASEQFKDILEGIMKRDAEIDLVGQVRDISHKCFKSNCGEVDYFILTSNHEKSEGVYTSRHVEAA